MKAVNKETGEEFIVSKVAEKYIDLKQEYGSNIAKVVSLNFDDFKTIKEQYEFYNSEGQKIGEGKKKENIKTTSHTQEIGGIKVTTVSFDESEVSKEKEDNEQTQNTNNKPKKQL